MSLKYATVSEPLHISVKWWFLGPTAVERTRCKRQSGPDCGPGFRAKVLKSFRSEAVYLLLGVDVGGGEVVEHKEHLVLRRAVRHLHLFLVNGVLCGLRFILFDFFRGGVVWEFGVEG